MIYISGQKFRGVHLTSWGGANSSWGGAPDKLGGCAPPKKQPKSAPARVIGSRVPLSITVLNRNTIQKN